MRRSWWALPFVVVLLALGCGGSDERLIEAPSIEPTPAPFVWPVATPQPRPPGPEPRAEPDADEPVPPAAESTDKAKSPRIVVKKGEGPAVVNLKLRADSTLVVTGEHTGAGNFTVELVPAKKTRVGDSFFGSVLRGSGKFKGQAAVTDLADGRYRAAVDAGNSWKLKFAQPVPNPSAKSIPRRLKGKGARVKQIRVEEEVSVIVAARYKGSGNFLVRLIPMQDVVATTGDASPLGVFNRVGRVRDEKRLEDLSPGTYLLTVDARGAWSLHFTEDDF